MRLLGQFQASLFFYEKTLCAQKRKSNQNQWTRQKQVNKGNKFSRAQKLLRGWKLFVLRFGAFLWLKFFRKKNRLTWNCPNNLIYYTTHVYILWKRYMSWNFLFFKFLVDTGKSTIYIWNLMIERMKQNIWYIWTRIICMVVQCLDFFQQVYSNR